MPDCPSGADRHEARRDERSPGGSDRADSGCAVGCLLGEARFHSDEATRSCQLPVAEGTVLVLSLFNKILHPFRGTRQKHGVAEGEESVLLFDGFGVELTPAGADERVNHAEQR